MLSHPLALRSAEALAIFVHIEKQRGRHYKKFTESPEKLPQKTMHKHFSTNFRERVIAVVKKIPKGKTMSYGEVARRAGHPGAARAVGAIMAANADKRIPCHRVIRSDGRLGGYNGLRGTLSKRELLKKEGAFC